MYLSIHETVAFVETRLISSESFINWLFLLWNRILLDLREYGIPTLCFNLTPRSAPQLYTLNLLCKHFLTLFVLHTTDAVPEGFPWYRKNLGVR